MRPTRSDEPPRPSRSASRPVPGCSASCAQASSTSSIPVAGWISARAITAGRGQCGGAAVRVLVPALRGAAEHLHRAHGAVDGREVTLRGRRAVQARPLHVQGADQHQPFAGGERAGRDRSSIRSSSAPRPSIDLPTARLAVLVLAHVDLSKVGTEPGGELLAGARAAPPCPARPGPADQRGAGRLGAAGPCAGPLPASPTAASTSRSSWAVRAKCSMSALRAPAPSDHASRRGRRARPWSKRPARTAENRRR